jgi:hypothetical protein
MATSTYLAAASVVINSTLDFSDQVQSVTFTRRVDQLEGTAMGDTARKFVSGLGNSECTITMYMSYAASETYADLKDLVGTTCTLVVKPTSAAASGTNPGFTLTGAFLAELPVINATMGELSTIDVTFTGGAYSATV